MSSLASGEDWREVIATALQHCCKARTERLKSLYSNTATAHQ
ncbi:hypothetical protein HMPREF3034_02297 [Prevotella sp. DNF00663]|nr:hypothetical protein HMPREF3034_02297 [Prevotella sp. DNF00663]